MRKTAAHTQRGRATTAVTKSGSSRRGRIHPVVIYPFSQPSDYTDLKALYQLVARLDAEKDTYARPITVIDRKTHYRMAHDAAFLAFKKGNVARYSDVLDAWCVDTCQMWYSGLGLAYETGKPGDVYWLIPGDFNYGTVVGQEVLGRLHDLPEIILELDQDLCIGEIATDHCNSKQLIDTYGTFALLYNWFPVEAQEIRQFTERPRSEFFAVRHEFLGEVLNRRWYPYEQTVVMLLQAVFDRKRITRFFVGNVSDLPEGRESFASALQQVERTERVLRSVWRERNAAQPGWVEKYYALALRSEPIRRGGLSVLENMLR
ncbi:MAG TPA: hypothetical protein VNZ64_16465 [Candidatus Acidoferrum sp.]|jgi:hypothetical protein|nr:hypothetical protein [Candidatus Acidoferrum sp.]